MELLIFLIVVVVLIVVHEFGHFLVAKWSGMRVDEFGLGFPPRAALLGKIGETEITLNWLPIGGFVRIYGEDGTAQGSGAFSSRPRFLQALVLLAGIAMNFLFAFLLLASGFALGTPRELTPDQALHAQNVQLAVAEVLPASPAATIGMEAGDIITAASDQEGTWNASVAGNAQSFTDFVTASNGESISLSVSRNGKALTFNATPQESVVPGEPGRYALGLAITPIGVLPLSLSQSIVQGAELTWALTKETAEGLAHLFVGIFTLSANLSEVSGPIGIAKAVGSAAQVGFGDVLSLAALISINLAFVNLIPIPALDGGRLLFVIIESVMRRPIKPKVANTLNLIGFAFLMLLIVVISAHDVYTYYL